MRKKELDDKLVLFNGLMTCPHRELTKVAPLHMNMMEKDPEFYAHLAAWYDKKGEVRDHKVSFIANLFNSEFSRFREVGAALFLKLPPYQKDRVIKHMKETPGLKCPAMAKTALKKWLRLVEKDHNRFDNAVMRARKVMKNLYASNRIKPEERANDILFKKDYPQNSPLYHLKVLRKKHTPAEQAEIIKTHQIPYPIACSAISEMSEPIIAALVEVMKPAEVINNVESLRKRGAFDNPTIKAMIESKMAEAVTDKRVSSMKAQVAAKHSSVSTEVKKKLENVSQKRIENIGTIKDPTAVFVDASSSMQIAIEMAKTLCGLISSICKSDLHVFTFNRDARSIQPAVNTMEGWRDAFKYIRAGGMTAIGSPLRVMINRKIAVSKIVLITDEEETGSPYFHDLIQQYMREVCVPDIYIVYVSNRGIYGWCNFVVHDELDKLGIPYERYIFNGDMASIPNIVPFITKNRAEIIMEIMGTPLPTYDPKAELKAA